MQIRKLYRSTSVFSPEERCANSLRTIIIIIIIIIIRVEQAGYCFHTMT